MVMRIRELRLKMGIRQIEFAALMGVSQSTVSSWERETYFPSVRDIPQLAKTLGCGISELFVPQAEEAC